jgi:hypothetical protein
MPVIPPGVRRSVLASVGPSARHAFELNVGISRLSSLRSSSSRVATTRTAPRQAVWREGYRYSIRPLLGDTRESSRPIGRACGSRRCLRNSMTLQARDARAALPGAAARRCVASELPKESLGVPSAEDQQVVEALPACRPHPLLSERVRLRRPDRSADDTAARSPRVDRPGSGKSRLALRGGGRLSSG